MHTGTGTGTDPLLTLTRLATPGPSLSLPSHWPNKQPSSSTTPSSPSSEGKSWHRPTKCPPQTTLLPPRTVSRGTPLSTNRDTKIPSLSHASLLPVHRPLTYKPPRQLCQSSLKRHERLVLSLARPRLGRRRRRGSLSPRCRKLG